MVPVLPHVRVQQARQVRDLFLFSAAQTGRHDRVREGNAVLGLVVRKLRNREGRGKHPVGVASVHGVRTRSKRLATAAPVRRVPRVLAVDNVRGDRQNRLGVHRVAVRREATNLLHKRLNQLHRDVVDAVIVVAELREVALD